MQQGVRFYAGTPLITRDGFLIGTICVAGFQPRTFSTQDRLILATLARVVMDQMEMRLSVIKETELQKELLEKKDEFISVASHELKMPITSLTASLQLLDRIKNNPEPQLQDRLITQANKSLDKPPDSRPAQHQPNRLRAIGTAQKPVQTGRTGQRLLQPCA